MNGSSFAAIHGRFAQQLDLPGSSIIPFVPWIALGIYIVAVLAIRRVKTTWKRWISFVGVVIAANFVIAYTVGLLERGSTRIPIVDFLSRESQATFEAAYPIKWVSYSASRQGTCVLVRRTDHSEALAEFVSALVKNQKKQNKKTALTNPLPLRSRSRRVKKNLNQNRRRVPSSGWQASNVAMERRSN